MTVRALAAHRSEQAPKTGGIPKVTTRMKSPKNLKPIEKNPSLLAAAKIRSHNDKSHCVTIYVQSADDYAGKVRIAIFPEIRRFGRNFRVDGTSDDVKNGFTEFCTEVSSADSYDSLMEVLDRHGFDTSKAASGFGIRMKRKKDDSNDTE